MPEKVLNFFSRRYLYRIVIFVFRYERLYCWSMFNIAIAIIIAKYTPPYTNNAPAFLPPMATSIIRCRIIGKNTLNNVRASIIRQQVMLFSLLCLNDSLRNFPIKLYLFFIFSPYAFFQ